MIIPIALAKEQAHEQYQGNDYIQSVKNNASAALKLYYEVESLKIKYKKALSSPTPSKTEKLQTKELDVYLREKDSQLSRLIKWSDIPAMTMISFPDADIRSYVEFKQFRDTIDKPILVRGIAAGSFIDFAREKGLDYYFIETGYFGNYSCEGNPNARKLWHRIVKNSMQHDKIYDVPGDRWEAMCKYDTRLQWKGWKKNGSKILLVAPSEKPCKYYGIDDKAWVQQTINELRKYTDREIIVREKGSRAERTSQNIIYDAFDQDIYAVVTYNSIAAAESVAYGIPAFALAPTAAAPVCLNDLSKIETPYYPDEEFVYKWLSSLAYGQFHVHELLTGNAWRMVLENEQRETISY
jgi:hypothetical protein